MCRLNSVRRCKICGIVVRKGEIPGDIYKSRCRSRSVLEIPEASNIPPSMLIVVVICNSSTLLAAATGSGAPPGVGSVFTVPYR